MIGPDVLMRVNVSARQLSAGDALTGVLAGVLDRPAWTPPRCASR